LQGEAQKLVLAAPNDLLVNELPEPMRKYRQEFPNVSLSLIDSASNPARRLLEENQVDLAVVGQLDLDLPTSLGVDKITSFPFTLVCPKSHPLLSLATVEPHDLAKYPLVMPSNGTNARRRANEIFSAAGLTETLRVAFETSTKELLLKYVQMEFGIGIAPISPYTIADCERHAAHVAFRDLSDSFGSEHVVILRRLGRREPEHQRALRMAILDAICN
jgi:DNA-binding transcriptional LysR family regulator